MSLTLKNLLFWLGKRCVLITEIRTNLHLNNMTYIHKYTYIGTYKYNSKCSKSGSFPSCPRFFFSKFFPVDISLICSWFVFISFLVYFFPSLKDCFLLCVALFSPFLSLALASRFDNVCTVTSLRRQLEPKIFCWSFCKSASTML